MATLRWSMCPLSQTTAPHMLIRLELPPAMMQSTPRVFMASRVACLRRSYSRSENRG
ncbi:MAG: hypothetical protein VCE91_03405 [Nitrospinota bacterium]